MKTIWTNISLKIFYLLSTEFFQNLVGLDNLAKYSEFVFRGQPLTQTDMQLTVTAGLDKFRIVAEV